MVNFTVQLEPPSVNHYVKHTKGGRHYVTSEAKAFLWALALAARGKKVEGDYYRVEFTVYQGKGSRGDLDNYAKCIIDGLVQAGVIHSDAAVCEINMKKVRDRVNPRTEIAVRETIPLF